MPQYILGKYVVQMDNWNNNAYKQDVESLFFSVYYHFSIDSHVSAKIKKSELFGWI